MLHVNFLNLDILNGSYVALALKEDYKYCVTMSHCVTISEFKMFLSVVTMPSIPTLFLSSSLIARP